MPYWQLFYHVVWSTKDRLPLIAPAVEPLVHDFIRNKALGLEGNVYALNGMPDHVHLVAAIPPQIAVANFIGQVKGVASARYNQSVQGGAKLYWQEEYSVFSFDKKRLPHVVAYVAGQKEHHANNQLIPALEPTAGEAKRAREASLEYAALQADWLDELMDWQ